jgi:hypothetical protein
MPVRPIFRCFLIVLAVKGGALYGQSVSLSDQPVLQRTTGAGGQDELVSLVCNWRGDIAALGNAARGQEGGQDILFVVHDAQMNKLFERHIGRKSDDGAGQITLLPDGRYLLAGFSTRPSGKQKTKSQYFGKRDGWLLVLNENGAIEKELILGTDQDDVFVSVAAAPDGSIWLAGNSQSKAWAVRLNASFEVVWQKTVQHHQLSTRVVGAALSPEGDFFITGEVKELNRSHLWVAGFSTDGQQVMDKIFPSTQAESGTAMVALKNRRLAVVGSVYHPGKRENGFLCILHHNGVMLNYTPLGGREFDQIHGLVRLHNGNLLTAGGSASFERGSRRISAWLAMLNDESVWQKEHYYGSKLDDEAMAIVEHPDGRIFAAGTTARQILKMRQGWLFQLSERDDRKPRPELLDVGIGKAVYPTGQNSAQNERVCLPFWLGNTGNKGQSNLRAVISGADEKSAQFLRIPGQRSVLIPAISGNDTLRSSIPLQMTPDCPPGVYHFTVTFFQGDKPLGEPQPFDIQTGQRAAPLIGIHIVGPEEEYVLGVDCFLDVEIRNEGEQTAQDISLSAVAQAGLLVPAPASLGDLAPGAVLRHRLPFRPERFPADQEGFKLQLRAFDAGLLNEAKTAINIRVKSAPAVTSTKNQPDFTVAIWVYPNPDNFERKELIWPQNEINVQIKIVSNQPVSRQQFCLEINGQPCTDGVKFDEVQIKGDRNSKTFSQTVVLKEGENILRAVVQGAKETQNEPLKIIYTPAKPNLHIVSIGVPSADLKYTTKDARDFAETLSASSNTAFGKIFLDTLLSEARTTKTEMLKTLRRLQYRYTDLQILPKDLLIVFVSGHGLGAYDGGFRLAASDYDSPFLQETSLDFEQEIVNYLQSLPCRKLFLVDACHSGTSSGNELAGIALRRNNLNLLASCQSDEYSYEDDAWQNGAFTRALVQGLIAFSTQTQRLDQNADAALDLNELFEYVKKEVPALVDKKKPKPGTSQHPSLFLSDKNRPPVLFELKKN